VGQHGIKRRFINATWPLTFTNITNSTEYNDSLAMDMEAPASVKNGYSGNIYTGFFRAPATANYRFYVTCDDACELYLSNVTMDPIKK
jgi:hypothetical protein